MSEPRTVECGLCNWRGLVDQMRCQLDEIPDLYERIEPGGEVPAGECPECGGLCYQDPEQPERSFVPEPVVIGHLTYANPVDALRAAQASIEGAPYYGDDNEEMLAAVNIIAAVIAHFEARIKEAA